ncbi:hypothetical protein BDY17DRAFT_306334 [Neohortaea acidophila]|uniref:Uncharacterized protein n=1 Tax=Neohortaea acidophila TaxID=245834 RepID=A0A6A6PFA0_9PEZI|nr:uncharacterized protein BDY17DRAFT_306334 [Neohortaea acidophila]KAF2478446.1 hypothetical protein BDY17DRAFT_306334 [Neohortaea acidophila]
MPSYVVSLVFIGSAFEPFVVLQICRSNAHTPTQLLPVQDLVHIQTITEWCKYISGCVSQTSLSMRLRTLLWFLLARLLQPDASR